MVVQIRTEAFARFESGESAVLVCTDAAARGLDIIGVRLVHTTCVVPSSSRRLWCSQVRNVVLFDFPLNTTEYLHRVGASRPVGHHIRPNACPHHALSTGRTARAASKGTATSLITKRDRVLARAIMVRPTRSHAFTPTRLHAGTMLMHLAFCTQEASKDGTVFEDLSSDRRVNVQQACVVVGAARDHCTSVLTQRVAGRACGLAIVCTVGLGLHPAVPPLSLALGRDLGHDKQRLLPVQRSRLRQSASRTAAGTFPRESWVAPLAPRLEVRGHLPSSPATLAALPVEAQLQ